ncbi:MAG: hypothetical protein A4E40_00176 [Methanoregulaceae archaeon PtaU1.Bin059]|nr:MAG: hypothetical protein A4E40_00176 [Methanoregulaceae archaeon PtaU1.Bin059]
MLEMAFAGTTFSFWRSFATSMKGWRIGGPILACMWAASFLSTPSRKSPPAMAKSEKKTHQPRMTAIPAGVIAAASLSSPLRGGGGIPL